MSPHGRERIGQHPGAMSADLANRHHLVVADAGARKQCDPINLSGAAPFVLRQPRSRPRREEGPGFRLNQGVFDGPVVITIPARLDPGRGAWDPLPQR
jgi:hypothetical protein